MSVYEVRILNEEHQEFVDNILKALADKHFVEVSERKQELLAGEPLNEVALKTIIEESLATSRFSAEETKTMLRL